ncbi:MAG: glycosyltransferase family 39 protein [Bacteroidales bacterium]|nr:glycosyltransferase family 39 protein [Bacteroidales bacterium]
MITTRHITQINWKTLFLLLLAVWFGINILQAIFTEIIDDESYYAFWGEHLAWGYYDHPPMVGLITHVSALLLGGNLSVRFLTVLIQIFTLCLIWKLLNEKAPSTKKVWLFFVLSASMIMFSAYGFITTADAPLLFFAALFLWIYQRFLKEESWDNVFLLGLSMAGMMYSKYHAVLVIGLIVLSNLRLLTRYKFWLAGIFAIILLVPHLLWQISEGFPGFSYHLTTRGVGFVWKYFLIYWPNQLVVFNPLAFGAVLYILFKYKPRDVFERGLHVLILGFIGFFFVMAFRGHVEPHWTVAATIPMIVLLYKYSLRDRKLLRFVKYGIAPFVILVFVVRIILATDNNLSRTLNFAGKEAKFKALETLVGDLPVVFTGNFQNPSMYRFFTKQETTLLSSLTYRQTQFDIWQKELAWQGQPAFVIGYVPGLSQDFIVGNYKFHGFFCENFQSANRLSITFDLTEGAYFAGDTLDIGFGIRNPQPNEIDFHHPELPVTLKAVYYFNKRTMFFVDCELIYPIKKLAPQGGEKGMLRTIIPDLEGEFQFGLTLDNKLVQPVNSRFVKLQIKNR